MWSGIATFTSMAKFLVGFPFRGWNGDGREEALLSYVQQNAQRGSAESVVRCIDTYAQSGNWFMNVGTAKGQILDEALARKQPIAVLELGTYCGYSAVRIASQLQQPGSKLLTLELIPKIADIAGKIIDHAGLSDKVEVLLAPLSDQIEPLRAALKAMNRESFDFVFIDHDKDHYLRDYLLLKENKLLGEGTVIFADNMKFPGSPKFWKYLQENRDELQTEYRNSNVEYISWIGDIVTISTFRERALQN